MRRDLAHEDDAGEEEPGRLERRQVEPADRDLEGGAEDGGHERGAQERETEEHAEREPAIQQLHEGREDELEVEPEAAPRDVDAVVAELVARVGEVPAPQLREPRHAGADAEALGVAPDVAHRGGEEDRTHRPRPDHVYVALDDVQELRDLVELVAAEEAADRGVERVAGRDEAGPDALLGVGQQGAELVDRERLHAAPDPGAAVEDRAPARELDRDRYDERHREKRDEANRRQRELPETSETRLRKRLHDHRRVRRRLRLPLQRLERRHWIVSVAKVTGRIAGAGRAASSTSSCHTTKKRSAQMARL